MALLSRSKAFASTRAAAPTARPVRMVVRASVQKQQQQTTGKPAFELPAAVRPVLASIASALLMPLPSFAAGKLFDFNLTLPIMAAEILLLVS